MITQEQTKQFYRECYGACTEDSCGYGWSICLLTDGNIIKTTCPSAHANVGSILAKNVMPSDFGDWTPDDTSEDEFVAACIDAFGCRLVDETGGES